MVTWNPTTYLQFADQRSRPFADLLSRVGADDPSRIVDLGCGPGQLTASLAERWPRATVFGLDSSPEMIERASGYASAQVEFAIGDLRQWQPREQIDVLVSNATLQWVPDHRDLFTGWVEALSERGWFAFQVPGNFAEPSHALLRDLAAEDRFAAATTAVAWPASAEPVDYLGDLEGLGCRTEVWETTYLHILSGPDPVFRWIAGTGARPVLQALPDDLREQFIPEYQARLRAAYPEQPYGTVLPFRRIFVVAQRR